MQAVFAGLDFERAEIQYIVGGAGPKAPRGELILHSGLMIRWACFDGWESSGSHCYLQQATGNCVGFHGSANHAAGPALAVANNRKSTVIRSIGTP